METFHPPVGSAGFDQVSAMKESVNGHIEQMFYMFAKKNVLEYGVGRASNLERKDDRIRLDARKRECDSSIVFHAGRSLELAFHVVYACGTDHILGREYPGVSDTQIKKDRRNHSLVGLYHRIINDLDGRNMTDALEDIYQRALHKGVVDLFVDDKLVSSFQISEDIPFRERIMGGIMDGAETTIDHLSDFGDLIFPRERSSDFLKMSHRTFENFLQKAGSVYYEGDIPDKQGNTHRKNMRWAHYSARDHEYGRPYIVIGTEFFARLVAGIVALSKDVRIWDKDFARRYIERRQYNIKNRINIHLKQDFRESIDLPDMITIDETIKRLGELDPTNASHSTYLGQPPCEMGDERQILLATCHPIRLRQQSTAQVSLLLHAVPSTSNQ